MDKKVCIFWDWNGTLIDDAFIFVEIMNVFLKQRDLDIINIKKYRDCFEFPIANYYKKLGDYFYYFYSNLQINYLFHLYI